MRKIEMFVLVIMGLLALLPLLIHITSVIVASFPVMGCFLGILLIQFYLSPKIEEEPADLRWFLRFLQLILVGVIIGGKELLTEYAPETVLDSFTPLTTLHPTFAFLWFKGQVKYAKSITLGLCLPAILRLSGPFTIYEAFQLWVPAVAVLFVGWISHSQPLKALDRYEREFGDRIMLTLLVALTLVFGRLNESLPYLVGISCLLVQRLADGKVETSVLATAASVYWLMGLASIFTEPSYRDKFHVWSPLDLLPWAGFVLVTVMCILYNDPKAYWLRARSKFQMYAMILGIYILCSPMFIFVRFID